MGTPETQAPAEPVRKESGDKTATFETITRIIKSIGRTLGEPIWANTTTKEEPELRKIYTIKKGAEILAKFLDTTPEDIIEKLELGPAEDTGTEPENLSFYGIEGRPQDPEGVIVLVEILGTLNGSRCHILASRVIGRLPKKGDEIICKNCPTWVETPSIYDALSNSTSRIRTYL